MIAILTKIQESKFIEVCQVVNNIFFWILDICGISQPLKICYNDNYKTNLLLFVIITYIVILILSKYSLSYLILHLESCIPFLKVDSPSYISFKSHRTLIQSLPSPETSNPAPTLFYNSATKVVQIVPANLVFPLIVSQTSCSFN